MQRRQKLMLTVVGILLLGAIAVNLKPYLRAQSSRAQNTVSEIESSYPKEEATLGANVEATESSGQDWQGINLASSSIEGMRPEDLGFISTKGEDTSRGDDVGSISKSELYRDLTIATLEAEIAERRLRTAQAQAQMSEANKYIGKQSNPSNGDGSQYFGDSGGSIAEDGQTKTDLKPPTTKPTVNRSTKKKRIDPFANVYLLGISGETAYIQNGSEILRAERGTEIGQFKLAAVGSDSVTWSDGNKIQKIMRVNSSTSPYLHAPIEPLAKETASNGQNNYSQ